MKITFVYHTCFCAEDEHRSMIFDYWKGTLPVFDPDKPVYIFVSHAHADHFNPHISKLNEQYSKVYYIFSEDIRPQLPKVFMSKDFNITWMKAEDEKQEGDMTVKAFFSTDEGVAYLIRTEDKTLMHFGDLNWWHWEGESDAFNQWQKKHFTAQIQKMSSEHINIAFGPALDARQIPYHWIGIDYFIKHVHVDKVFPMHFFDEMGLVKRFLASDKCAPYRDKMMLIEKPGQEFNV